MGGLVRLRRRQALTASVLSHPHPSGHGAITSAAQRVDLTDRGEVRRQSKLRQPWQPEAWTYRDAVPQVGYGMRFLAGNAGRLRLYPALATPDAEQPVPLADAEGVPPSVVVAAEDALARLSSDTWLWSRLLEPLAENLEVAGECYLVGHTADGTERWEARSTDAVAFRPDGTYLVDSPAQGVRGSSATPLDGAAYVARLWRPHSQWPGLADAPMRQLLSDCETLLLAERAVKVASRSRLAGAGILLVPHELDVLRPEPLPDGIVPPTLMEDLTDAMLAPIQDEASVSSVVPLVLRGPSEALAAVRQVSMDRPADPALVAASARALLNIGQGLDLPPEVLSGLGDANHWSAWAISSDMFRNHLQPLAIRLVDSLTVAYLRVVLPEYGVADEWVSRVVVWFDPSLIVTSPNRGEDAAEAFDRYAISTAVYLDARGFDPDTDQPDDAEIERRLRIDRERRANRNGGQSPTTPQPDEGTPAGQPAAVAASAGPLRVPARARRLTDIDRSLRDRVHAAAEAALARAVERANNRVRGRLDPATRQAVAASLLPPAQTLGEARVAAVVPEDELFRDALTDLEPRWRDLVAASQDEALRIAVQLLHRPADDPRLVAAVDRVRSQHAAHSDAGWQFLAAGLLAEAGRRLYAGASTVDEGEQAAGELPYGLVRGAVALAGGLPPTSPGVTYDGVRPDGGYVGGIGTGDAIGGLMRDAGAVVAGYEWVYGIARRPFEPHRRLDGLRFATLHDPRLAHSGWPAPILAPGDHKGCFVAGTPVSGPHAVGSYTRAYEGPGVEIVTAGGKRFTATPNHPVLTPGGWVAVGRLHEGDHVVAQAWSERAATIRQRPHDEHMPASIEEVAAALPVASSVVTRHVPVAGPDFHGDGAGSQVCVVRADGGLLVNGESSVAEPSRDPVLVGGGEGASPLPADGHAPRLLLGAGTATSRGVGSGELRPDLFVGERGTVELGRLTRAAAGDAQPGKLVDDREAVAAVPSGESVRAHAGLVVADEVAIVRAVPLSCHVYNLQTTAGWYLADGIVVHNCSCDLAVVWDDAVSAADVQREAADASYDPGRLLDIGRVARQDEAAGRYGYPSTSPIDTVAEAVRIGRSRPSQNGAS
jgi:hypothetical protein